MGILDSIDDAARQVGGVFKGAGEALWETGEGIVNLGVGLAKTGYDTSPLGLAITGATQLYERTTGNEANLPDWLPSAERGATRLEAAADVVGTIVQDPGLLVDAVVAPIRDDWNNGNYGEAIGRGAIEVLGVVFGTKGVDKLAKTGRIADAAGDAARVARAADRADTLSDAARAGRAADAAGDTARTVRAVDVADELADGGRATNVTRRSAEDVNRTFPEGYNPPYQPGTQVADFTTTVDAQFVRVHIADNRGGRWIMRREDIEGLPPEEIARKYSLPQTPTHVSDVHVPADTRMRVGHAARNFGGEEGALQYQLIDRIPEGSYSNTRPLGRGGS